MSIYYRMALGTLLAVLLFACSAGAAPFAYITNYHGGVSVFDAATNTVTDTIGVEPLVYGVATNPAGTRVYVANGSHGVSVIDTATNTVTDVVTVGTSPHGVAVSPEGKRLYVTNYYGDSVSVIDTATNTVIATVGVGHNPIAVAVSPDGTRAYVANYFSYPETDFVSVIDTVMNKVIAKVGVGILYNPHDVMVSPDGTRVYVANVESDTLSVIDTATNSVIATVAVGLWPEALAVNPAGTLVYVANAASRSVSVIDTATNKVADTINLGDQYQPMGIVMNPEGTLVYVTDWKSHTIVVIDPTTHSVAPVNAGSYPYYISPFVTPPPPPTPSLSVERVYAFPPETEMFMNYSVYALVQNPLAVQEADVTVFCLEDDADPQGLWGDHLDTGQKSQQKTLKIGSNGGLYEFKYAHSWNWLGPQSDSIFNIITDNSALGNEILEALVELEVPPLGYALELYSLFDRVMTGGYYMKPTMIHEYTLQSDPPIAGFSPVSVNMNVPRHKMNALVGYWVMQPLIEATTGAALITVWNPAASLTFAATEACCIFAAEGMKKIAVDPDMNYPTVVQRRPLIMPEVEEISGSSPESPARDMLAVVADINALADTLAKYDGAVMAGDTEWMMIHLSKASEYSEMTVRDLSLVDLSVGALIHEVRSQNIPVTDADIDQAIAHLSAEGLPGIEVEMLKRMHYSDGSIAEITDRTMRGISARRDNILQFDSSMSKWIHTEEKIFTDLTNALNARLNEGTIPAEMEFQQGIIDVNTPPDWISVTIDIPGGDVKDINLATVRLDGIPASEDSVVNPEIGDWDSDGYEEIRIKFPFDQVRNILSNGQNSLTITGLIGDERFLDRESMTVTGVIDPPVAAFTGDPPEGVAPLTVRFTDRSVGAEGRSWAFGDGETSDKQGPSHTYATPGTYTVALTVRNDEGSDTRTRYDYIHVSAPAVRVPVKVKILPRTLNLASKGAFVAFVRLPDEYETSGVLKDSISCGGAPAERIIRSKKFPHVFGAIFRRDKLEKVPTGDEVTLTLEGNLAQDGRTIEFSGTDTIRVINRRNRIPDELEDVSRVIEDKLFDMYGKENP